MAKKNPAAVALGRKGGLATAKTLTEEERKASARRAAQARWSKLKSLVAEIDKGTKRLDKQSQAAQARWSKAKEAKAEK